jgi:LPS export ABC transporter permease LptG
LRLQNRAFRLPLMRLLDRYLLRELLFALVVCFSAFLLLFIMLGLLNDLHRLQEYHLHGGDVAEYYFYSIPDFMPIAVPVSLLLALLYAVTNHARYNEITAIRAAGVSLGRMCLPYMAVGLLASIGLFALNEIWAPQAAEKADQVLNRRIQRQLTPAERRMWNAKSYNTKTFEMAKPLVVWIPTNGGPRFWLSADSAVWTNGIWVFSGDVEEKMESLSQLTRVLKTTNSVPMPEFSETPKDIQSEINVNVYRGLNNKTHRADIPLGDILNYLRLHPQPDRKTRNWLYTKLHGRFAGPFACLVVVFVAVPFAAGSGRRNVFVGVAASIFIFFAYFLLQQVGLTFGETGWVPSWFGAWFPNLFFGATGLFMMARVR